MSPLAFIGTIVVALVAAAVLGALAKRLGQPAVLGELLAGTLLGLLGLERFGLDIAGHAPLLHALGEAGVLLLLLDVGLESDFDELRRHAAWALAVAGIGVLAPVALGTGAALAMGSGTLITALFLGATLAATSVGITARVFRDLGALGRPEAQLVLAAAVADDVLGLLLLAGLGVAATESSSFLSLLRPIGGTVLLGFGLVALGRWVLKPLAPRVPHNRAGDLLGLVMAGIGAAAASLAGLAAIVGSFAVGVLLKQSGWGAEGIRKRTVEPLVHVLGPLFFVQVGASVKPGALVHSLGLTAVLLAVAVAGKLLAGLGAPRSQARMVVGLAMVPRGEVGLIFAQLGLQLGVLENSTYAAAVAAVFATTVVTPPLLRAALRRHTSRIASPGTV